MFQRTPISWENLKYRFITEDPTRDLSWYSYETQLNVFQNPKAVDYPFMSELRERATKFEWEFLKRDSGNLDVTQLIDNLSKDLKIKIDRLGYLNNSLQFLRDGKKSLEENIHRVMDSIVKDPALYELTVLERAKIGAAFLDRWITLDKAEGLKLGIKDVPALIEKMISNYGEGKTLEEVAIEVQNMDEIELTQLFSEITGK